MPADRVFLAQAPSQYPQHALTPATGQGLPPPPPLAADVSSRMHQTRQVNLLRELLSGYAAVQQGKRWGWAVALGVLLGPLLGLVGGALAEGLSGTRGTKDVGFFVLLGMTLLAMRWWKQAQCAKTELQVRKEIREIVEQYPAAVKSWGGNAVLDNAATVRELIKVLETG